MKLEVVKSGERRIPCQVPHCGKTTRPRYQGFQWICADHWKLVDKSNKQLLRRTVSACEHDPSHRNVARNHRAWDRCVRQAIEAAAGIA